MDTKAISFIYFDVGGVAVLDFSKTDKWHEMAADLGLDQERLDRCKEFFREHKTAIHTGKMDRLTLQEQFLDANNIVTPSEYDLIDDFVDRFEKNIPLCAMIESYQSKYRIGLLTNMFPGMLDSIKARHLLPDVDWDVVVDSVEVGLEKPDEQIFIYAEDAAGVHKEGLLFVDNLEENIAAAQRRGWQTFLYDPADHEKSTAELELLLRNG